MGWIFQPLLTGGSELLILSLALSDDNSGNWGDAQTQDLTVVSLDLSDDSSGNWGASGTQELCLCIAAPDDLNSPGWLDTEIVIDFGVILLDDLNSPGWADLPVTDLQVESTPLTQPLSDDLNSPGWVDTNIVIDFGVVLSDDLNSVGWFDTNIIIDFGLILSDDLNNWSDGTVSIVGDYYLELTDDLNNPGWVDTNIVIDFGVTLSDDLNNGLDSIDLDAGQGGQTLSVDDNLNFFADYLAGKGFAKLWKDSDNIVFGFSADTADTLDTWADSLVSEEDYGLAVSDQETLTEFVELGYGFILEDGQVSWLDAAQVEAGQPLKELDLEDTLDNWLDDIVSSLLDAGNNVQLYLTDTLVLSDELACDHGLLPESNLDSWLDQVNISVGLDVVFSDDFTLTDQVDIEVGLETALVDDFSFNEDIQFEYGSEFNLEDVLLLSDYLEIEYEYRLELEDDLNTWDDFVDPLITAINEQQVRVDDDLNSWDDSDVAFEYGHLFEVADTDVSWLDAVIVVTRVYTRTMCMASLSVMPAFSLTTMTVVPAISEKTLQVFPATGLNTVAAVPTVLTTTLTSKGIIEIEILETVKAVDTGLDTGACETVCQG